MYVGLTKDITSKTVESDPSTSFVEFLLSYHSVPGTLETFWIWTQVKTSNVLSIYSNTELSMTMKLRVRERQLILNQLSMHQKLCVLEGKRNRKRLDV